MNPNLPEGRAYFAVDPSFLVEYAKGKGGRHVEVAQNRLPDDAQVVCVFNRGGRCIIELASKHFPKPARGHEPIEVKPIFKVVATPAAPSTQGT